MNQYQYGMTYRPAGLGAVPKGVYTVSDHPSFRHGVIQYDRPLTDEEIRQFELTPIGAIADHAQRIVDKIGRYASQYAENDDALEDFVTANQRRVGMWSTDDYSALLGQVKSMLSAKERVCECSLRTKLVGDGCSVCNPELAREYEELARESEE